VRIPAGMQRAEEEGQLHEQRLQQRQERRAQQRAVRVHQSARKAPARQRRRPLVLQLPDACSHESGQHASEAYGGMTSRCVYGLELAGVRQRTGRMRLWAECITRHSGQTEHLLGKHSCWQVHDRWWTGNVDRHSVDGSSWHLLASPSIETYESLQAGRSK